jgi:hypothetical protein
LFDSKHQFLCIDFSTLLVDGRAGTMVVFLDFHGAFLQRRFPWNSAIGNFWTGSCKELIFLGETIA